MGGKIKRKINVSCVDANTGKYVVFDENSPRLLDAIVASAAIPLVFPPVVFPE